MIVDTSALIAIIKQEPEAELLEEILLDAAEVQMSVGNLLELHLATTDYRRLIDLPRMLRAIHVIPVPVSVAHLEIAKIAHDRFGRGSGHKASLNYGDCFAYALAKATKQPLLFKGNDFALTDIEAVPY